MSPSASLGTIKRILAILIAIAIVLAAGIVVGQAPALFGVEPDLEASIEFEDQTGDGDVVVIDEVSLSDGGFVVVTDGGDEPIAVSEYLGSGTHDNVTVERDPDVEEELVGQLTATVHQDTTGDETYAYEETDGEEDRPYLEDGFPVADTATVTPDDDPDDPLEDSFAVDEITAPAEATTDDTIEVTAVVSNPTDIETQQAVELRFDGTVYEQQLTEGVAPGESTEVSFEVGTEGVAPGERTVGVYTEADGAVETIDLEFHTDPTVSVVDADEETVTVDVATPVEGFVAIEDDDGEVLATTDQLEAGEHSNVTAAFDENVTVDEDEELTAVLYEGDPDDLETATPYEDDEDDERVEATFTIAEAADAADGNDE